MKQRTRLMNAADDLISYNLSKKTDGDDGEIQMHKMKHPEHFIEAQVQEGDTLQAIALRFYCSISELKRINHIHKDNEIFARRTLKIPVTPYSVLTELIPAPQTKPTDTAPPKASGQASLVQNILLSNVQQNESLQNNNTETKDELAIDCNSIVLNSTVAPALVPYKDVETTEFLSEDTQLLPSKPKEPVESVVVKQLTSQGADFGLKWFHLVICILILGVIVPLIYVYSAYKHELEVEKNEAKDLPPLYGHAT